LFKPKKSLGQNFLQDENIVKKILSTTEINNQNIIEIGPGYGILTNYIINLKPKKLIIIEKDIELYSFLKKKFKNFKITILNEDIIDFNFPNKDKYKIISNLPYNISSKFIFQTLRLTKNISEIVCMIQSELAKKYNYSEGKMNKYKFLTQYCSKYKINFRVSRNVFYPKPNINSQVVKFTLNDRKINYRKLDYFLKFFFINKRKKIKSNKYFLNKIDLKYLNYRYEDLKYNDILKIYETFKFPI